MPLKVIIFDMGGVFIKIGSSPKIKELLEKCEHPEKFSQFWKSHWSYDFDANKITAEEFYNAVVSVLGYSGNFQDFLNDYCSILWPNEQMFGLLESLRTKNPKLDFWLLSNVSVVHWEYINKTWPNLITMFSKHFPSCAMYCVKPYGNIYKKMYEYGDEKPENTVFVDDQPINGLFPKKLGAKFIHFQKKEQLMAELASLGVIVRKYFRFYFKYL